MFTIDTSVFVADQHSSEDGHAASRELITRLAAAGTVLVLPTLLLVEMGGTLARVYDDNSRAYQAVQRLRAIDTIQWVALDELFAEQAAAIAAVQRLRGADGVFVAVAQQYGTHLISLDREQRTRAAGIIPTLTPEEALQGIVDGTLVI